MSHVMFCKYWLFPGVNMCSCMNVKIIQPGLSKSSNTPPTPPHTHKIKAVLPVWLQSVEHPVTASLHTLWAFVVYKMKGGRAWGVSVDVQTKEKSVSPAVLQIRGTHAGSSHLCHVIFITATRGRVHLWKAEGKSMFSIFECKWIFVKFCMILYLFNHLGDWYIA